MIPESEKVKVKVAQSCLTLCNPMDYTVHGILQARLLEWGAIPEGIFPTQGSNPGLPHCRRILLPAEPPGKPTEEDRGSIVTANAGMSFKLRVYYRY